MPTSFGRIATAAVMFLCVTASARAQQSMPYSAVAEGIDKVCTPATEGTGMHNVVYLARFADETGAFGPWQPSNPALEERAQSGSAFHGDDFLTVREGVALFTATVVHRSGTSPRTQTEAWCFVGGQLARATVDAIDPDVSGEWRHTQYFNRDTDKPAYERLQAIDVQHPGAPVPRPSADGITLTRPKTPADLPFYAAYESALGPKLSTPKP
jgi:hypothetical protein